MSWPAWPPAGGIPAPVQSTLMPAALNSAPAVMAPVGYSQEQWAQAQQQNWQQWAQWQQQYQQWHQQYGAEYQKSISAMQAPMPAAQPPLPAAMAAAVAPPLPTDNKPPLPPEEPPLPQSTASLVYATPQIGYSTTPMMIPPPQTIQPAYAPQTWQSTAQKRPHNQEPDYDPAKRSMMDKTGNQWKPQNQWQSSAAQNYSQTSTTQNYSQPSAAQNYSQLPASQNYSQTSASQNYSQPPPQVAPAAKPIEELSEAEKKFDKEFAAWEAQFNKWKDQNVNHPDKTQYKEYEKKWESWRNSLLERREQMRRKRIALTGQTPPAKPPIPPQANSLYSKPPPTQNNEPLVFKPQGALEPEKEEDDSSEGFLKPGLTSAVSAGGIPGLDLVEEDTNDETLPDRSDAVEPEETKVEEKSKGPDFEAISKGINSILGDQKLLSILSMVSQNPPSTPVTTTTTPFAQNFAIPPPNLQQLPPTQDKPIDTSEDFFNNQGNRFNEPPPGGKRNYLGSRSFDEGDNSRSLDEGDSFAQDNQRNNFTTDADKGTRPFAGDDGGPRSLFNTKIENPRGFQENFDPRFAEADTFSSVGQKNNFNADNFPPSGQRNNFNEVDNFSGVGQRNSFNAKSETDNFQGGGQRGFNARSEADNFQGGGQRGFNSRSEADNFQGGGQRGFNSRSEADNFQGGGQRGFNARSEADNFSSGRNSFNPKGFNEDDRFNNRFDDNYEGRRNFNQNEYDDYDNYNDEEDYDKYNDMFRDEEEHHYQDKISQQQQQVPHKIPSLMDQIAPAPPHIRPLIEEEPLFEPATVVDYEHRSKREPDNEVTVMPVNMFDYRNTPLNRTPLVDRPKWLAEAVKFIREFDPVVLRFEKPPVDRFAAPPRDEDFPRFEPRFKDYNRGHRDDFYHDRKRDHSDKPREDRFSFDKPREERFNSDKPREERFSFDKPREERFNSDKPREERSNSDKPREERFGFDKPREERFNSDKPREERFNSDKPRAERSRRENRRSFGKEDFEDFSDTDMDFEHNEQVRHKQVVEERRSKSKSPELSNPPNPSANKVEITMVEDIINPPGRFNRPPRIVVILRGPPGSGKTFLAKQIKDKEVENGGSAPRILSLDDYFMVEQESKVMEDGKMQTVKKMVYEYEAEMEESYRSSFMKSFKKTITDGYFPFIIVDNVNDKVKHFGEMWSFAKQNGFQVYVCQMDLDPVQCAKRNIHNRSETEIEEIISGWEPTPSHHPTIDASGLLQAGEITDVEMEVVEEQEPKDEKQDPEDQVRSKWDNFDCSSNNLAKLDGVSKPIRKSRTMEEYLQMEEQWEPPKSRTSGKKRVRWADLEEQRELEKMRAIGFVVGHTNWDRMMDPTGGRSALTQTKYIEKVSRYKHI